MCLACMLQHCPTWYCMVLQEDEDDSEDEGDAKPAKRLPSGQVGWRIAKSQPPLR